MSEFTASRQDVLAAMYEVAYPDLSEFMTVARLADELEAAGFMVICIPQALDALVHRLDEMHERGQVVYEKVLSRVRFVDRPEDAMYELAIAGEKRTYGLRGSEAHTIDVIAKTLADLEGSRPEYIEAMFLRSLAPGKQVRLGNPIRPLRFIVTRLED